jgi:hypothetical protein
MAELNVCLAELFILAFGSQVGVIGDLARLLLDGALRLMPNSGALRQSNRAGRD